MNNGGPHPPLYLVNDPDWAPTLKPGSSAIVCSPQSTGSPSVP